MAFIKNISVKVATGTLDDKELISIYKADGEMAVLGELYQRYMDLVYAVCLKYFKDAETAKDAVMAIFEELVVKLKKHDVENFKGWLHQLAKNHCLMQLRTPRNLKTVEFSAEFMQNDQDSHLETVIEREQDFQKLASCIDSLAADQQFTIRLFYLEGKCYNEIAATTKLEWKQVRSFIQNGKRNLKACMEKVQAKTMI